MLGLHLKALSARRCQCLSSGSALQLIGKWMVLKCTRLHTALFLSVPDNLHSSGRLFGQTAPRLPKCL